MMRILGLALLGGGVVCGVGVAILDYRLREFRRPDINPIRYWMTPGQFDPNLYTVDGQALLSRLRVLLRWMWGLSLSGMVFLMVT